MMGASCDTPRVYLSQCGLARGKELPLGYCCGNGGETR